MITSTQLVQFVKLALTEKWGYVYGAQGETYTKALAEKWKKAGRSVPSGRSKATYFTVDCAKWIDGRVADCSGLLVWAIRQEESGYSDRTANTFRSQFSTKGKIATIPEVPGLAVWRSGHIGIYIGNGEVIEARGTAYGVVKTKLKDRDFTEWGYLRDVDYSGAAKKREYSAKCTGNSVNIRTGAGTSYAPIGQKNLGDPLIALGQNGDWIEVITAVNGKAAQGYMSGQYVKVEG